MITNQAPLTTNRLTYVVAAVCSPVSVAPAAAPMVAHLAEFSAVADENRNLNFTKIPKLFLVTSVW
jgi:hypothetical protein